MPRVSLALNPRYLLDARTLRYAFLTAASLAALFASIVLWIGLEHNPQGEFYGSELGINWEGIFSLWSIPFVAAFIVTFPIFVLLAYIITKARSP